MDSKLVKVGLMINIVNRKVIDIKTKVNRKVIEVKTKVNMKVIEVNMKMPMMDFNTSRMK